MRRWWGDNIKIDFKDVAWVGGGHMDWIGLAQDQGHVAGYCKYDDEPPGSIKCVEFSLCPEIFLTIMRLFMSVKI